MTDSSRNKPLRLNVTKREGAAVMTVSGSVSMAEADRIREKLEELADEKVPVIVLELSRMDFICSVGLGAIIVGHLKCRHHSGRIKLVSPIPSVRELLETTRLTKLFDIYDSVEEALSS